MVKKVENKETSKEVEELIYRLNTGSPIELSILREAFTSVLTQSNSARDVQLGSILTGMMVRGPTAEQTEVMLRCAFAIDNFTPHSKEINIPGKSKLVCAVGSGKKGYKVMNISTPASLIAASAGAYTAKAVSLATSSATGSGDLLRLLGANIDIPVERMIKVTKKVHFGAYPIENTIPKFDKIYGGKFYAPHPLSFGLAALASPIKPGVLLYGLAHPNIELSINVLKKFGVRNAMVVSSTDDNVHYLDELGVYGTTKLIGMRDGNIGQVLYFNPLRELRLPHYSHKDIAQGKNVLENVKLCINILRGRSNKAREDIVCINAGSILYLAGLASELPEGFAMAKKVVREGLPYEKLLEFVEATGGNKNAIKRYI
jgi:anthranilate phosphoribosyltransferase